MRTSLVIQFFGRCFQHTVKSFCLFALQSHCALSTSVLLLCRVHTHCALFADSGFVILTGQTFEAVPAPERSELIILTSYSPPSRSCCTTGMENSFVESLCRTWRIRKCLKSTMNDFWNQPQNRSAALFSEQWSGTEFMGLKFAVKSPRQEDSPRIQIEQHSRSWWGVSSISPTRYVTHLTECTFMSPYFTPCVRVIWNPLTWILHLNLHMSELWTGMACWDKSLHAFRPRCFPYISDFTVS